MTLTPFHVAVPVRDIAEAREFYAVKMGLTEGRSAETWIDFNMFGHQFVVHLDERLKSAKGGDKAHNDVDGHGVPVPHFGVVLNFDDWHALVEKAKSFVDEFIVEPYVRFEGEVGEQGTMFFADPSGNALEFKAFRDIDKELFATD